MTEIPPATTNGVPVAATIVNYFSHDLVRQLMDDLIREGVSRIVVLDNSHDRDEWTELVRVTSPKTMTEVIRAEKNLGFGVGHNRALAHLRASNFDGYAWLCNPDMRISTGCLNQLRAAAAIFPEAVLSPLIEREDGRIWFSGGRLNRHRITVSHDMYGESSEHLVTDDLIPTDFISGAAIFADLMTLRQVPFASDLFLYWEDVLFSEECRELRFPLLIVPSARVTHAEGGTSGATESGYSATHLFWTARNRLLVGYRVLGLSALLRPIAVFSTLKFALRPVRQSGKNLRYLTSGIRGTWSGIRAVAAEIGSSK